MCCMCLGALNPSCANLHQQTLPGSTFPQALPSIVSLPLALTIKHLAVSSWEVLRDGCLYSCSGNQIPVWLLIPSICRIHQELSLLFWILSQYQKVLLKLESRTTFGVPRS